MSLIECDPMQAPQSLAESVNEKEKSSQRICLATSCELRAER
jgi:hypothetical protein